MVIKQASKTKSGTKKVLHELAAAKAVGGGMQPLSLFPNLMSSVNRPRFKDLELVYLRFPIASRGIEIRANDFIARGYEIVCKDAKAKKELEEFLEDNQFDRLIHQAVINTDLYGNGYIEIIFNGDKTDVRGLKVLHPKFIDLQRTAKTGMVLFKKDGTIKGFVQNLGTSKTDLRPDQMMHFVFKRLGDEVLGHSILEPCLKTIERCMNIEEGIAQAIFRHGFPQFDISVGDEANPPTPEMIDEIADKVQDLNSKNEFVHTFYQKISVLESRTAKDFSTYPQVFIRQVVACLGVPEPLILGTGEDTNKSTADVQIKHFAIQISALQHIVKLELEDKLFKLMAKLRGWKDIPKLEWNETLPQDENDKISRVSTLFEKQIITRNEARELIGLPKTTKDNDGFAAEITPEEKRGSPQDIQSERVVKQERKKIGEDSKQELSAIENDINQLEAITLKTGLYVYYNNRILEDLGVRGYNAVEVDLNKCDNCESCKEHSDKHFTIAEAKDVLPVHKDCTCFWKPV